MKTVWRAAGLSFLAGSLIGSALAAKQGDWVASYNDLLGKYVTSSGVKYGEWRSNSADRQALQNVVDAIAQASVSSLGHKEQFAFYVNAYNAWILHEALEKYPTRSVKDAFYTFFTSKRIKVAGEPMSFNHLEKDIIRARFATPLVHFALNCASRSCPPLNARAFRAGELDAQMEKLATAFVNSENGVRLSPDSKSAGLSKIFEWYKDDFKSAGGALSFINKRRHPPLANDIRITYQDYDWRLNEAQ